LGSEESPVHFYHENHLVESNRAIEGVGMSENRDPQAADHPSISGSGPLAGGRAITKLPAQNLDRARAFYQDKLGLAPVEEREGGLRYLCAAGEFHLFLSTGAAPGTFTQMGFEVENIEAVVAELRSRGVVFEVFDLPGFEVQEGIAKVAGNYPSKGIGERGVWFRDSEGNLLGLAQPVE
jgi:catechol 2,3-dioxygenase-like lactoylglutathione lyase family enzyme